VPVFGDEPGTLFSDRANPSHMLADPNGSAIAREPLVPTGFGVFFA